MLILTDIAHLTKQITVYGSHGANLSHIAQLRGKAQLSLIRLEPGGRLGRHPAASPQLLWVIEGEGQVSGEDEQWHPLVAGQAVYWNSGEQHATQTSTGLTALIVEGEEMTIP